MINYKYNHGFIIMRCQPFHKGHQSLVDKMLQECKYMTVILGTTQESRTQKNPFTYNERKHMFENIYKNHKRFKSVIVFGLDDIPNDDEWYDYVLNHVKDKSSKFGKVDAYYCGNDEDGTWFDDGEIVIKKIERSEQRGECLISATKIREMIKDKNPKWKKYIAKENIQSLNKLNKFIHNNLYV